MSPSSPQVSVLVPVYNGERHLAESLESIRKQDFPSMEILIADDGSTDGSRKIIEDFAARDPRVRWWKNPRNLGLAANSNQGVHEARGEYIKYVHQDDLLLSDSAIGKLVAALENNPGASLAGGQQHVTGSDSPPNIFSRQSGYFDGKKMIVACLEQNNNLIGQPSLTLFRRRLGQRGFDGHFNGFLDFELWCHLLEQGDFAYVAEPLATWRAHRDNQTARNQASGRKDYDHLRFMETYYAKPWLKAAATDRLLFAQIHYLKKRYGREADHLTSAMLARLTPPRFAWQWLKHTAGQPWKKLARKFRY